MDTVCRLYEVGRQRLAEEEEDEEDQVIYFYEQDVHVLLLWIVLGYCDTRICFFHFSTSL